MADNAQPNNNQLPDNITFAGDPLPLDPENNKVDADKLTDKQKKQVQKILDQLHAVSTKEAASLLSRIPIAETREALQELLDAMRGVQAILDEIRDLEPYINAELDKPEYNGITIIDILDKYEPRDLQAGPPEGSTLAKVMEAAREKAGINLPKITYNKGVDLELNLDKLNTTLYDFRTPAMKKQIEGQLSLALPIEKAVIPVKYERDNAPEVTLFFNYNFDHELMRRLNLPENIDDEDFFCLSIIADNYVKGNDLISATKLYRDLNGADPNTTQLSKFVDRLYKLLSTTIYINDKDVLSAWKAEENKSDTYNEIVGPLAPMIMHAKRYTVNGRVVDGNIKIIGFPLVFQTGRAIGQRTTIPKSLLAVKRKDGRNIRHTARYYKVLHYLIREIARIKNGTRKNKLLYDTFIVEMGEKTARGKQLAMDLFFNSLDHFTRENWIKGYKEETTKSTGKVGVKILFDDASKKKHLPANKRDQKKR